MRTSFKKSKKVFRVRSLKNLQKALGVILAISATSSNNISRSKLLIKNSNVELIRWLSTSFYGDWHVILDKNSLLGEISISFKICKKVSNLLKPCLFGIDFINSERALASLFLIRIPLDASINNSFKYWVSGISKKFSPNKSPRKYTETEYAPWLSI